MREQRYNSTFLTSALNEAEWSASRFYSFIQKRETLHSLDGRLCVPRSRSERYGAEKILLALLEIELVFLGHSLYRLSYPASKKKLMFNVV
jgi:hypothetical protein